MAFSFILLICLYISKYEKLVLISAEGDVTYLIENRMLIMKSVHRFSVSHIVSVKLKESGKSTKCYALELNIVDGRVFSVFASGVKKKTLKKQFMIRRFIEEYFESKALRT